MNDRVEALSKPLSGLLRQYYRGIDHPFKLRFWYWIRRRQHFRRLTVRYGQSAWLTVDERCFIQRHIFVDGAYEPEVIQTLLSRATGREVVWDVGANIGSFAVDARLSSAVKHVVCFEPDPENRAILETNLSLNGGASFEIHSAALSDRPEQRSLWKGPTVNRGMSTLADPGTRESSTFIVDCATVDDLVFEHKVPPPTLLKMDVEGWEYRVLLGARRLLGQIPPKAIVFESRCTTEGGVANREICDLLANFGYGIRKIPRPSTSVDAQENFLASRQS